jgi:hypothetical protein
MSSCAANAAEAVTGVILPPRRTTLKLALRDGRINLGGGGGDGTCNGTDDDDDDDDGDADADDNSVDLDGLLLVDRLRLLEDLVEEEDDLLLLVVEKEEDDGPLVEEDVDDDLDAFFCSVIVLSLVSSTSSMTDVGEY